MKTRVKLMRTMLVGLLISILLAACGGDDDKSAVINHDDQSRLNLGDTAPTFTLPTADGGTVSLADYQGNSPVLLFFHMAVG